MNIKEKLVIAERAIASISAHSDEDSIVVLAALDRVKGMAESHSEKLRTEQQERAEAATGAAK